MGKKPFQDRKNVRVFRLVDRSVMGDTAEFDEEGNPLPSRVFAEVTPGRFDEVEDGEEEEYVDVGSEGPDLYIYFALCLEFIIFVL